MNPPVVEAESSQVGGGRLILEASQTDLHSLLKTFRVDVPHFNGTNVENWIYRIDNFFALHKVEPTMRLAVVSFHLDGEPYTWFQWMEKAAALPSCKVFIYELRKRFGASIYVTHWARYQNWCKPKPSPNFEQNLKAL